MCTDFLAVFPHTEKRLLVRIRLIVPKVTTTMMHAPPPQRLRGSSVHDRGRKCYPASRSRTVVEKPKPKESKWKVRTRQKAIEKVLDHWAWSSFMATLTIYALFGDDIRLAATAQPADDVFFSLSTICLSFFLLELFLASIVKSKYRFSFYFYLDLISCISMVTDIGWLWMMIIGDGSGKGGNLAKSSQIARAARASRAGTRAGRIIRVVRVARLIRMVRLYKIAQERRRAASAVAVVVENRVLERSLVVFRGTNTAVAPALITATAAGPRTDIDSIDGDSVSVEKGGHGFDFAKPEQEIISDFNTCTLFGTNSRRSSLTLDFRKLSTAKVSPILIREQENNNSTVPEESKVGQKLSEITTKRIIILILGMMFFLPLFSTNMYVLENTSYEYGLMRIDATADDPMELDRAWGKFIDAHANLFNPVVYVEIIGLRKWQGMNPDDLRPEERRYYVLPQNTGSRYFSWAVEDLRPSTRIQAGLNMARTIFICVVLTVSGLLFSKDANDLVIGPIENMTNKIKKMIENPLDAAQDAELDEMIIEEVNKQNEKAVKKKEDMMETELLEKTIVKIGTLLVLGFGEAGAEIIASNMKHGGGDIDPIVDGKRTHCIFGFCDIRDFSDVAEVLQEGVMNFVNEIAYIVHSTVYKFSGAANKNIGDAFLLVWKIPKEHENPVRNPGKYPPTYELTQIADMALVAFLKILAAINSDQALLKYRLSAELRQRIPNYTVKMGFGLHVGWAIEGAIGSEFKVDASYLSPNVNLASRLEAATRQFGVPILVSGQLVDVMSPQMRSMTRQVDCVLVKGSKTPIRLYTMDVSLSEVPASTVDDDLPTSGRKAQKQELKRERDRINYTVMSRQEEMWTCFDTDDQLISMRKDVKAKFIEEFRAGFEAYISGDWQKARRDLEYAVQVKGEDDGPTSTLLAYMSELSNTCPANWAGCRELTEK